MMVSSTSNFTFVTKPAFIGAALLTITLILSAIYWWYVNEVRYYRAADIPNLTVKYKGSSNGKMFFLIQGRHIGPIGSIGKTTIIIKNSEANIMLVRALWSKQDKQTYKKEFSITGDVTKITFGPDHNVVWRATKS